jgi:hypothetical protein
MRPSYLNEPPSKDREGAGKAGCPPHPWSACNKKARGRTTGTGGSSGLPCAMVLRLIRDLSGDHAWLPPSPREMSPGRLSACIGAPRPHDFAVRRHVARRIDIACVHRIPPHVRDDRETPLLPRRDEHRQSRFRKKRNKKLFVLRLDDSYRIDPARELSFWAQAIFETFEASGATRQDGNRTDLPDKWRELCHTGGFRQVVAFPPAPIATGWSDPCREGLAPSQEPCLSTAHGYAPLTHPTKFCHRNCCGLRMATGARLRPSKKF